MKKEEVKQNYNIHLLRILAAFLVVLIHVSATNWYILDTSKFDWNITNALNGIGRVAVPIFFMISGVLLLGKEEINIKKLYTKQILKLVIIYIVWSIIYASYQLIIVNNMPISIDFLKQLFYMTVAGPYHFWYIPAIIGVYIVLPILNSITKCMDEKVGKYLFTILLVGSIIQTIGVTTIIPFSQQLNLIIAEIPLGDILLYSNYTLLGYYLMNYDFSQKTKKLIYVLGLVSLPLSIIMTSIQRNFTGELDATYYLHFSTFVFLQVIAIFIYFKNKNFKIKEIYSKEIKNLSSSTLGIYIIHPLIIFLLLKYNLLGVNNYSPLFMIPLMTITVFFISCLITKILRKIKYIKDWLV